MLLEGLSNMVSRFLRVPPGATLRHPDRVTTAPLGQSSGSTDIASNEYVNTIVDITVDDICIGEEPLSINWNSRTPELVQEKLKGICKECNSVVKWIAKDLCITGLSIYSARVGKHNRLILLPYFTENEFHIYLTADKEIFVVETIDGVETVLEDILVFINYDKDSLVPVKDDHESDYAFEVLPSPMQVKNAESSINALSRAEANLDRYRGLASRVVRIANVDIGTTQGDQQDTVRDTISSVINANSAGLGSNSTDFDDSIPVVTHRRGLGKVELQSDIPNYNLKDVADIDYHLSKINLLFRFPSTYMDFTKNMDAAAASLIRGDIRYAKLTNAVRTKIVETLNEFVNTSKFSDYEPCFTLTQYPNSEDDDVMAALEHYIDIASAADNFVLGEDSTSAAQLHRLKLLQDLFASSTTSPTLNNWFEDFREFIESGKEATAPEPTGGDFEEAGSDIASDLGPAEPGLEEGPSASAPVEEVPDVEIIQPQTM